jgi:hypothetical protein
MGTVSIFLVALVLSSLVGVGVQLALSWNINEEFITVSVIIPVFAVIAMAVFAIAYSTATRSQTLGWAAAFMIGAVVVGVSALVGLVRAKNGTSGDITILLTFLTSALIIILVQWALIARRWRKLHPAIARALN